MWNRLIVTLFLVSCGGDFVHSLSLGRNTNTSRRAFVATASASLICATCIPPGPAFAANPFVTVAQFETILKDSGMLALFFDNSITKE